MEGLEPAVSKPAVKSRGHGADGVLQECEAVFERGAVERRHAHQHVAVAVDILGHGVHDDVGAVVERVLEVWRHEGVVHNDHDAVLVRDGRDIADVDEAESWVAWGFDPDQACLVGADQFGDVALDAGGEGDLDAVGSGDLGEIAMGAAVDVGDGDNVGASGE